MIRLSKNRIYAAGYLFAFVVLLGALPVWAQEPRVVTAREINAYPQASIDELNAAGAGLDPGRLAELMVPELAGQSVRITAVVLSNPRTSGLGNPDADGWPNRIHVYVRDTSAVSQGNEGMGIQLVDGAYRTTGLLNAAVGDVITVVGVPDVFTGLGGGSMQLEPESVELLGPYTEFGLPESILDPVTITTAEANMSLGGGQVQTNWSNLSGLNSQYVRIKNATLLARDVGSVRPNWLITTDGGETLLNVYDMSLRYRNDRGGIYNETQFNVRTDDFIPPAVEEVFDIQGFLVFQGDDPFTRGTPLGALLSLVPFADSDLADLALTNRVDDPSPGYRDAVVFTIRLVNNGPNTVADLHVASTLPDGLDFIEAVPSRGTYDLTMNAWTVGALPRGAAAMLTLSATVNTIEPVTSSARIPSDTDPSNNVASARVTPQAADLSLTKSVDNSAPDLGETVTYTIEVSHRGGAAVDAADVIDRLPEGILYVSDQATRGSYDAESGVWTIGSLARGGRETLALTVVVDTAEAVTNVAEIGAVSPGDPFGNNNTGAASVDAVAGTVVPGDIAVTMGEDTLRTERVEVSNVGPRPLGYRVQTDQPWLTADPDSGTIAVGASQEVALSMVNSSFDASGIYEGAVTFYLGRDTVTVSVVLTQLSITGSEDAPEPKLASLEVYPNPARTSLELHLNLPHDAEGRLSIFDVLGREVLVLGERGYPRGQPWRIQPALSPGVYALVLQTNRRRLVRSFVWLGR